MIDKNIEIDRNMRLDFMPPEERAKFSNAPYTYWLEPFCVEGNLYFIGNKEIGCYLIDTGDGLIILDTGYENCAGQFFHSIWSLGYNPKNVKMIFHTHNHPDHIASTNLLVQLSGAKTYMSEVDGKAMVSSEPSRMLPQSLKFVPDVYTKDGDEFTLGNTTVKCVDTPGHSRGCQSFFVNVTGKDGKQYIAALHGGIGINSLHKELLDISKYHNAPDEFFGHLERIVDWPVDIYLSSHTFQNYTEEKLQKRAENPDGPNPFIDPAEWKRILTTAWVMGHELIEDEKNGNEERKKVIYPFLLNK